MCGEVLEEIVSDEQFMRISTSRALQMLIIKFPEQLETSIRKLDELYMKWKEVFFKSPYFHNFMFFVISLMVIFICLFRYIAAMWSSNR